MDDRRRGAEERLNRLWDAALGFAVTDRLDDDTAVTDFIAAFHAADDAPEPDPTFLARLRQEVVAPKKTLAPRAPVRADTLALVYPRPTVLPPRSIVRIAIAAIAAALLVAALSGGSHWLSGSAPAPMVASAMASSVPLDATPLPTATEVQPGSPEFGDVVQPTTATS